MKKRYVLYRVASLHLGLDSACIEVAITLHIYVALIISDFVSFVLPRGISIPEVLGYKLGLHFAAPHCSPSRKVRASAR